MGAAKKGFRYDAFLSYARLDDRGNAWVERFFKGLNGYLSERLGRDANVFKDTDALDANQFFNPVIKEALDDSAVLVSVISPAFQASTYCQQEVRSFYESARTGLGLDLGSDHRSRTFNVLRFNVGFEKWFEELGGINPVYFYEKDTPDENPIDPDSKEGMERLQSLARQIAETVDLTKDAERISAARSKSAGDKLVVFLAPAYKSMSWSRRELADLLNRVVELPITLHNPSGVNSDGTLTEAAMIAGFQESDLAVVMVRQRPEKDTLKQLELAQVYAQQWILVLHPDVDLSAAPDDYHARLIALQGAEGDEQGRRNYKFVYHQSEFESGINVREVYDEAIDTLKWIKQRRTSKDLMLDGNPRDRRWLELIDQYIANKHKDVNTRWASDEASLADSYRKYQDFLDNCPASMVVYGEIERQWVQDRLDEVRKVLRNQVDKSVGVFYGSPPVKKERFPPQIQFGTSAFKALHEIDSTRDWHSELDMFLFAAGLIKAVS